MKSGGKKASTTGEKDLMCVEEEGDDFRSAQYINSCVQVSVCLDLIIGPVDS